MRRYFLALIGLLLLTPILSAQEKQPAVTYGRVTMSGERQYEWLDLLGIAANELTADVNDPVYSVRLRVDVWEPGDKEKPRWSGAFGSGITFKEKTPVRCTFRLYFMPPRLKNTVPDNCYPAYLSMETRRDGQWAGDNPTGWFNRERLAFPENYMGIEGATMSVSAHLYDVPPGAFDHPVPFFHYCVAHTGYSMKETPEETRKANPHAVHIIGWLEPVLEEHSLANRNRSTSPPKPATNAPSQKQPLALLPAGAAAPTWELERIGGGEKFSSAVLQGKVSIINFWTTWCGHCLVEMPAFIELQEKYGSQGLQFVGLNMDRELSKPGVERFVKWQFVGKPLNYPVLFASPAIEKLYGGIDALPTTYIVGRDGKIVDGWKGEISKADLEKRIGTYLRDQK